MSINFGKGEEIFIVDNVGNITCITTPVEESILKTWHNDGMRLLVSIDPETGKAVTKSLKVGEE